MGEFKTPESGTAAGPFMPTLGDPLGFRRSSLTFPEGRTSTDPSGKDQDQLLAEQAERDQLVLNVKQFVRDHPHDNFTREEGAESGSDDGLHDMDVDEVQPGKVDGTKNSEGNSVEAAKRN